jgi:DMSO/TMAO reductase YedYZ molybdopterin-dependent catalytic subunit
MKKTDQFFKQESMSEKQVRSRTIIAFSIFAILLFIVFISYLWIKNQPKVAGTQKPLRTSLNINEKIFSKIFDSSQLVKEYPKSAAAKKVRVNGYDGLKDTVSEETWRLHIVRKTRDTLKLALADIKKLPKREIVFDFKCIEGWSQVTHWAGVPLKTFIEHYHLEDQASMKYIGLQTPNKKYYVGIHMPSALQSQTLLCYEMNGKPLPVNQGFPLRLIIPVKYGIKHLKRIGTMFFSNNKPADYWAERGYDYYAGH